ncbi:cell division protein [Weissella oryzae SG25]|uniref:Cell division protein n=1 Tax=Weissella oryzae (strain DSM 25784 / JCM 18191 / LMG 30913 / SG25) TaxID=1329250 RepID=A0A069CUY7_WEIOS|nr:FtsW/RodA/SpoVE family cell cycle protein [Weissella oryzae]GAK31630.1 cell division protein [Weissella oryzae SG25]
MFKRFFKAEGEIDWGIIFVVMMLALIGLTSLFVAASHDSQVVSVARMVAMQGIWYVLGIIAILVIMRFDSEQLWRIAPYIFGFGIFLMLAVLVFYSRAYYATTGGKSWFAIGSLTFQPSEIMKPALIVMLARVIAKHNTQYAEHTVQSDRKLLLKIIYWVLPVIILILAQHDFGTMLVFLAITAGMVLVSGITWKILGPIFGAAGVLGTVVILLVTQNWGRRILGGLGFQAYQFARVDAWMNPSADTSNSGYQLWQAMKAIGSGGVYGTGFNVSHVNVPVRESDMIFSVIGENYGFIGSALLLLLYMLLFYQIYRVVRDTSNQYYAYIAAGVIMMLLFHIFENIGMNIGLVPLTGIPLPFISQGGSALIGNMIGIGLIMSMRYHHRTYSLSNQNGFA